MSTTITIAGTPIDIPTSGTSPDWAPAVVAAFKAIEGALLGVVNVGDVAPQVLDITPYNTPGDVAIPNLSFSNIQTRSASISYAVYRDTDSDHAFETGVISAIYDTAGNAWVFSRERTGDGLISFDFTGTGQVTFSVDTLPGTNYSGFLTYSAKALQQV